MWQILKFFRIEVDEEIPMKHKPHVDNCRKHFLISVSENMHTHKGRVHIEGLNCPYIQLTFL